MFAVVLTWRSGRSARACCGTAHDRIVTSHPRPIFIARAAHKHRCPVLDRRVTRNSTNLARYNRRMRRRRLALMLLLVLVCPAGLHPAVAHAQPARGSSAGLSDLSRSLQELAAKVRASVVQIFVTGYVPPDEEDRAQSGEPTLERTSGSGV